MAKIPILSPKQKYGQLLENNETVFNTNTGNLSIVKGDSHSDPSMGERIELKEGDKIFSDAIKLPKEIVAGILDKSLKLVKKMSPAELSKKYPTTQYDEILNSSTADKRATNTAKLMKAKNVAKLEAIFQAQEDFKDSKGVVDGVLLKDQGLNKDLEPIETFKEEVNEVGSEVKPKTIGDIIKKRDLNFKLEKKLPNYDIFQTGAKIPYDEKDQNEIIEQYKKLGLVPPLKENLFYTPNTQEYESLGYLQDHPFIKSGLYNVSTAYNNKNKQWYNTTEKDKLEQIKKANNWTDQDVVNTIRDYQKKSIGLNDDGTYKEGDEWINRRQQVFKHNLENNPWTHQQYTEVILPNGAKDYRFNNYDDGDNMRKQIIFQPEELIVRNKIDEVSLLPKTPKDIISNIPRNEPNLNKLPDSFNEPNKTELPTVDLQTPKELQKDKISKYLDLFTRQKAVPYLKNDQVTTAYQRILPLNTLAQERSQNFMNHIYDNSDASSQLKQANIADNYSKTLEGIADVQLKNYNNALQIDNQNNQTYMNAFNTNEQLKNNNMAEYVGRNEIVNDQFEHEGDLIRDSIRQLNLQQARTSDDFAMRKLSGLLTNDKFVVDKNKNGKYGIAINPLFTRLNTDASDNPLFQQDNKMQRLIQQMRDAGIDEKNFDDFMKAYKQSQSK